LPEDVPVCECLTKPIIKNMRKLIVDDLKTGKKLIPFFNINIHTVVNNMCFNAVPYLLKMALHMEKAITKIMTATIVKHNDYLLGNNNKRKHTHNDYLLGHNNKRKQSNISYEGMAAPAPIIKKKIKKKDQRQLDKEILDEIDDYYFQRTIKKLSYKDNKWIAHGKGKDNREKCLEVCEEWLQTKMVRDDKPLFPLKFLETIKQTKGTKPLTKVHQARIIEYGKEHGREKGGLIAEFQAVRNRMDEIVYRGKQQNGVQVALSYKWLEMNTRHVDEKWFNDKIVGNKQLNKWHRLPSGYVRRKYPIKWRQGDNQSTCFLGNILNCLYYLGDETTFELTKIIVDVSPDVVDAAVVKRHLIKNSYQITNIKTTVTDFTPYMDVPICGKITEIHRIVVWKGWIIDGLNEYLLPVTQENLDWCCGHDQVFTGMVDAFLFFPCKRLQKHWICKFH
jgi:hypothetical protein